jgi:hypothetical protein
MSLMATSYSNSQEIKNRAFSMNYLPEHVAVQEEDSQLQCLLQHDQLHAVQPHPSHILATWQSSFLCPETSSLVFLSIGKVGSHLQK